MSGERWPWVHNCEPNDLMLDSNERALVEMAADLAGLGYADEAVDDTNEAIRFIRQTRGRLQDRQFRLAQVWRALNWWRSGDSSESELKQALAAHQNVRHLWRSEESSDEDLGAVLGAPRDMRPSLSSAPVSVARDGILVYGWNSLEIAQNLQRETAKQWQESDVVFVPKEANAFLLDPARVLAMRRSTLRMAGVDLANRWQPVLAQCEPTTPADFVRGEEDWGLALYHGTIVTVRSPVERDDSLFLMVAPQVLATALGWPADTFPDSDPRVRRRTMHRQVHSVGVTGQDVFCLLPNERWVRIGVDLDAAGCALLVRALTEIGYAKEEIDLRESEIAMAKRQAAALAAVRREEGR